MKNSNQKGITIISLVITVIVLAILAVSIIVNTVGLQHTIISIIYNESIKSKNCKNAAQAKITIHIILLLFTMIVREKL